MRRTITASTWEQVKTGYAAGIGLREIARNMELPAGTVLAKAHREGWTQQIQVAKQSGDVQSPATTPLQAVAGAMRQRAERHVDGLRE